MLRPLAWLAGVAAGSALLAASGAAAASAPAAPCAAAPGVQVREAGRYVVTLKVGPVPRMVTAAEAARTRPTSGVVMLEPMKTVDGGGMMGGAGQRHLRVQVCDRRSGRALRSPRPTAEITAGMARFTAPLTLGYDAGTPPSDVRFCQVLRLGDGAVGVAVHVGALVVPFSVLPGA